MDWVEHVVRGIEAAGVAVIVVGGIIATVVFLLSLPGDGSFKRSYRDYREHLGRAILLGLEFLVAGDIIATIMVEQTLERVGVLAIIVLIRTFLSFALETEIEGRPPWRRSGAST